MDQLLKEITDNEWKYLDDDMIIICYRSPPKWIYLMRRITIPTEYVRTMMQFDVLMEEEILNKE